MSLLLKALEKAAQDRGQRETATSAAHAQTATTQVLGLEPMPAKAPVGLAGPSQTQSSDARSSTPVDYRSRGGAMHTPQLRAQSRTSSPAQAAAASVLNAQGLGAGGATGANGVNGVNGAVEWLRARPVYAFGALAVLFLAGYGAYVYVQVFQPGLLRRTPVRANPALVNAPASTSPPVAATAPSQTGIPIPDAPSRDNQVARDAEKDDAPPPATAASAPIAVSMASTRETTGASPARPGPPAVSSATSSAIPPAAQSAQSAQLISPPARIAVNRADTAQPRVNPLLAEAYAALERGQLESAQRLYNQAARAEPNNVDALLGLAAIAQAENRGEDAQRHFMAVLEVDPRNALAQSGLINQSGRFDPATAETRLKQLIAREPSAPLHFSLGNLYADQGLWPQAQQAYFQAHYLDARNPDYAYNLAVGLEHLGQPRLALDFYRKAVALAAGRSMVNFDTARVEERIARLAARQAQ